ncbi:hypothetical protein F5X68DRAFT_251122 [Plectosphaerella plurivora]|uniref:Uncharacterized protein n=1 Tax=Plectosphaerella plurivora TaxID=936078 RepID=A0A9P8V127_9PEZI|nr:hypothetical protein F5X68DRAFT_251122 [Plectosphaerella plurivora]
MTGASDVVADTPAAETAMLDQKNVDEKKDNKKDGKNTGQEAMVTGTSDIVVDSSAFETKMMDQKKDDDTKNTKEDDKKNDKKEKSDGKSSFPALLLSGLSIRSSKDRDKKKKHGSSEISDTAIVNDKKQEQKLQQGPPPYSPTPRKSSRMSMSSIRSRFGKNKGEGDAEEHPGSITLGSAKVDRKPLTPGVPATPRRSGSALLDLFKRPEQE